MNPRQDALPIDASARPVPAQFRAALRRRLLVVVGAELLGGPDARGRDAARDLAPPAGAELVELAIGLASEGCVRATIEAVLAAERLARASEAEERDAVAAEVDARTRLAELAWRVLAWALEVGGEDVRWAVVAVFRDAARYAPEADDVLAPARALDEIVRPCAARLLGHAASRAAALGRCCPESVRTAA